MHDHANPSPTIPTPDTAIVHYVLEGLFPPGHTLAFNPTLETLSLLRSDGTDLRLVAEQHFGSVEACVLRSLLDSYPHYCPYELLHASFASSASFVSPATDLAVTRSRKRLQAALDDGTWEEEMRPVRNCLSRVRIKLRPLGIHVRSIFETGCLLMPKRQEQQETTLSAVS